MPVSVACRSNRTASVAAERTLARSAGELVLLGVVDQVDHVGEFKPRHQAHFVGTDGLVADAELGGDVIPTSTSLRPIDLHFSAMGQTVAQVQVDETLIRYTYLIGHTLEILHNVF